MEILDDTLFFTTPKEKKGIGHLHKFLFIVNLLLTIYTAFGHHLSIDYQLIGTGEDASWWYIFSLTPILSSWTFVSNGCCLVLAIVYLLVEFSRIFSYSIWDKLLLSSAFVIAGLHFLWEDFLLFY